MTQLAYLSDGIHIVSGGDDDETIKLWNTSNGFCFVIFSKHASTATGLEFVSNGQFIVSSSFDGTVRTFDLFECISICSKYTTETALAICSWNKTLRSWSVFVSQSSRETFLLSTDALCCALRHDGKQLAVSTVDAQILFLS
ncbi:unnamed protein product [Rotaria sp. Silwood1]|nr:unnamed protein product [Rotaria sp. Silwood1]CAF1689169.1 unnamed protein product [Rotaria sp. Silwood1]